MKRTLFPEIEQEILDDRKADRRAQAQHARAYLGEMVVEAKPVRGDDFHF